MSEPTSSIPAWFPWVLLYLLGLALFFLELFLPSGGIIALAALLSVGYAIYNLFQLEHTAVASGTVLLTFLYLIWLVRWGLRRLSHIGSLGTSAATGDDVKQASTLLGKTGRSITPLRPSGMAKFGGRRLDVVAKSGYIDKDCWVEVILVDGNRVVVRQVPGDAPESVTPPGTN